MEDLERTYRLRPAERRDVRKLAELWTEAFPSERSVDLRIRSLLEEAGPYGGLETCWIVESHEERLLGAFRHYSLRMHLWGRSYPVQGLASVAVAPDARRRGVGGWMCRAALRLARERGDVLSVLFPFRSDFYAKMGYALIGELHRYEISTGALPTFPEHDGVRRLTASEAETAIPEFYASVLSKTQGLIERTPEMWRYRFDQEFSAYGYRDEEGRPRGYALVSGRRAPDPDQSTLRVHELLADDGTAYRGLLGWLSTQRDQWPMIRYDALPGESFHRLTTTPRLRATRSARGLWFQSATILRGPMLRVVDLPALLDGTDFGPGAFLQVRDSELPENSGTWVGSGEGPRRDDRAAAGDGGLPIGLVAELFVEGGLPGQEEIVRSWSPTLGIRDFRLLDVF